MSEFFIITEEVRQNLVDHIVTRMCYYDYDDQLSDYCCEFCGRRARSNKDLTITHKDDCDGVLFLKELSE